MYNSLVSDLQQVLLIKENYYRDYLASLSDPYLLSRDKTFLEDVFN